MSKPKPRVLRATGPRLLHDHPQPMGSNRGPSDPKSSTLTTRLSCHRVKFSIRCHTFKMACCYVECGTYRPDDTHPAAVTALHQLSRPTQPGHPSRAGTVSVVLACCCVLFATYRPDDTHPAAVMALHQGLCLRRVLKDAKSVKHESIVTFHSLRYDVYSQLANFDQTSGIKVCTTPE